MPEGGGVRGFQMTGALHPLFFLQYWHMRHPYGPRDVQGPLRKGLLGSKDVAP